MLFTSSFAVSTGVTSHRLAIETAFRADKGFASVARSHTDVAGRTSTQVTDERDARGVLLLVMLSLTDVATIRELGRAWVQWRTVFEIDDWHTSLAINQDCRRSELLRP